MKAGTKAKKYSKGGETISAEEKRMREQMIQGVRDEQMAPKLEEAYNKSLRNTMPAPKKEATKKPAQPVQKRAMGGMMNKMGYAAGGVVKARGMGAATRGGKCKMS
jgi:hypothetical protein